jgi:outer membrane receptor protein involved in Fe transport
MVTAPGGRAVVGVYVDGFRVPGDPGDALSMINAADVEGIEVYRGPSELPAEFMSDDCAAIVIWTRY